MLNGVHGVAMQTATTRPVLHSRSNTILNSMLLTSSLGRRDTSTMMPTDASCDTLFRNAARAAKNIIRHIFHYQCYKLLCATRPGGGAAVYLRVFPRLEPAVAMPAVAADRFIVLETAKPRLRSPDGDGTTLRSNAFSKPASQTRKR